MINRASCSRGVSSGRNSKKIREETRKMNKFECQKTGEGESSKLLNVNDSATDEHAANLTQESDNEQVPVPLWRSTITGHPCGLVGFGLSSIGVGIYMSAVYQQVHQYSEENEFRIIVQTFVAIFIMSISTLMIGLSELAQRRDQRINADDKTEQDTI